MRFAIDIAPLGDELSDPATIVRLARAAEARGWEDLSTWDTTGASMGVAAADPFDRSDRFARLEGWIAIAVTDDGSEINQARGMWCADAPHSYGMCGLDPYLWWTPLVLSAIS